MACSSSPEWEGPVPAHTDHDVVVADREVRTAVGVDLCCLGFEVDISDPARDHLGVGHIMARGVMALRISTRRPRPLEHRGERASSSGR